MRPEARLEREILKAIGRIPDLAIHRNEVGSGYTGNVYGALMKVMPRDEFEVVRQVLVRHRITYGLGVGSPDLVGALGGRFIGLELKSDTGRLSDEQVQWHTAARRRGVAVFEVRSVEDAVAALERCRKGGVE